MNTTGKKRKQTTKLETQGKRKGMALLLIFALLMNTVIVAPRSQASDGITKEGKQEFTDSGYKLELLESSGWDGGYVAEVVVSNMGKEELRNWSVIATITDGDVGNSWNVENKKIGPDQVVFESESHNMVIRSGENASFGFQVTGGNYRDIVSLKLIQGKVLSTSKADIEFRETSSWDGHKIIEATITNKSETPIRDWSLTMEAVGKINNIWNAVVMSQDSGNIAIQNRDYNAIIEVGASVTFGFEISYDTDSFSGIQNVRIYVGEGETNGEDEKPSATPAPTTAATEKPSVTSTPETTPVTTKDPEKEEDISEDDIEFVQVENRDWNMDMIHANDAGVEAAKENTGKKIKVTMLDSGINYSREVDVVQRKNFVEGEDEMTCLFEDGSGHGTAIAEVLASNPKAVSEEMDDNTEVVDGFGKYTYYSDAQEEDIWEEEEDGEDEDAVSFGDLLESGYEWTEGVNPNIELYSGKILDADNETTVERVVEGIEWAIENDTDILSLSIGMDKNSEKLHKAIQKAAASGMLIIAAVGDDEKVDYPAAYPEVMAVGMVNSMGETTGIPSEVVAPGDSIVSRGVFDSMEIFSGSSMAVPHVVGLASILWQKDTSKEADFIRGLIDVSANRAQSDDSCRYGLIDCSYALGSYATFEKQIQENDGILDDISRDKNSGAVMEEVEGEIENQSEVETEAEMEKLHGNWESSKHKKFVSTTYRYAWTNGKKYVDVLWEGIQFVDMEKDNPKCYGMREHPWFHGFYGGVKKTDGTGKTVVSNYMTSFRTLVELADQMRRKGKLEPIKAESGYSDVDNARKGIWEAFKDPDKIGSQTWKDINTYCGKSGKNVPKDCRSFLIYGMALHTLGDTFSHSSFGMEKKKIKDKATGKTKEIIAWKRFTHKGSKTGKWYADNTKSRKLRYDSAKTVTQQALKQIEVTPGKGLTGYKNLKNTTEAFFAKQQFKELKQCFYTYVNKQGTKKELPKTGYFDKGYALKDFSKYYETEAKTTGRTSKKIENHKKYVDKKEAENQTSQYNMMQLIVGNFVSGWNLNGIFQLKTEGKTIASQKVEKDKMAFVISMDTEYEVVSSRNGSSVTICTIKDGNIYDAIGRTMNIMEADGEEETEDVDDELDESENLEVCDILNCEPSTDCLVKGKVVYFDFRLGLSCVDDMPGLSGVNISLKSRDTGKLYQTTTKKDGTYQVQIPAGNYDVTYKKGDKYKAEKQFLKAKGDMYRNLTVEMLDEDWFGEGYIDGYFYDKTTGLPLSDVSVKVYEDIGYYEKKPVDSIKTDENGYFSTDFLEAGSYTFVLSKEGYATQYCYEPIIGGVRGYVSRIEMARKES